MRHISAAFAAIVALLVLGNYAQGKQPADNSQKIAHVRYRRCAGTRHGWCGSYFGQQQVVTKAPPAYSMCCPGNCSAVGVCNAMTGICDCPAGDLIELRGYAIRIYRQNLPACMYALFLAKVQAAHACLCAWIRELQWAYDLRHITHLHPAVVDHVTGCIHL